ncbi:hypothetical protein IFM89_030352 [Coptis chinensis]|uniref:SnoaL-like domain-containing protein n=1 Tax=Coptis chinensis TaxID=261450 RepID=A0A835M2G8_9MAGN|nr:hypothetical protein IFM89_030352 [Coptis chinensis]
MIRQLLVWFGCLYVHISCDWFASNLIAIDEDNYVQAAKIRDSLRFLQEDSKASVLAANACFYNCFRKGDLTGMQALWAKRDNVCCVHRGWCVNEIKYNVRTPAVPRWINYKKDMATRQVVMRAKYKTSVKDPGVQGVLIIMEDKFSFTLDDPT